MKRFALTFIGKDRSGIIAGVSRELFEAGCNIEDTTMTILEGQFAMILIALLPNARAEGRLKGAYERLRRKWGLHHFWKELPKKLERGEKHPAGTRTWLVSVMGRDRTGIVYETSRLLAKYRLNITDLNCKIVGGRARPIFAMILEVDIPKRFNVKRLEPAWRTLKHKLGMDVRIRPLERLPL